MRFEPISASRRCTFIAFVNEAYLGSAWGTDGDSPWAADSGGRRRQEPAQAARRHSRGRGLRGARGGQRARRDGLVEERARESSRLDRARLDAAEDERVGFSGGDLGGRG